MADIITALCHALCGSVSRCQWEMTIFDPITNKLLMGDYVSGL